MSPIEARIAEVVGAHVPSGTIVACGGCSHDRHDLDNGDGSQVDTWDARWHDFADHLAEVLAPVIREAQAEALREAADLLAPKGILWWGDSGVRVSDGPFGMPQGSLDDWLRNRADNLEAS